MENVFLKAIASVVLPAQILDYFTIVGVEQTKTEIHISLDEILNFYNNRSSNALAESFNAKIKLFRANLRGVADKKFFIFRISTVICLSPLNFY